MAITKEKKQAISEKLDSILENAETLAFINFHGLDVVTEEKIRGTLREAGVSYYVAKKTLMKRALDKKSYKGEMPSLDGEVAIVYSDDQVAPAREAYAFAKKEEDPLTLLGGVFEGEYLDKAGITEIAAIPGQQQLYGMFANVINSPIQGLVIALNAIAEKKEA
jgi:large subunit ribosomal protein L10